MRRIITFAEGVDKGFIKFARKWLSGFGVKMAFLKWKEPPPLPGKRLFCA